MQGRITEQHLPDAERSMPGITAFYAELDVKPATFLDLLWAFEARPKPRCKARKRRAR